MVGDGANDCGALKAAHTGISLSDTESSVASPFTSRETNVSCVLTVIREGRAALVTSFGIFKYMAAYSLTQFISVMILYSIDSNLTDIEFLYIDLFIISIFAFFFGRTEAYEGPLVKMPPLNSLISTSPIFSLIMQILIVAIFQYLSFWHLQQKSWFVPFNVTAVASKDDVGCYENYTIFIVSSMQYIILAVAFSKGPPYRKSLFTNYGLLTSFVFLSLFSVYLAVCPFKWLADWFELVMPDDLVFRFVLVGYGAINFLVSLAVEYVFVEYLVFGKLRYRWHDVDKSRRKFLAIERDMARDLKWPPLSQEPLPEASSDTLIRQNVTEIKIERRVAEPCYPGDTSFMNSSPVCSGFKHFGSAREVTLNPRSLFDDCRNTVSMQTVPCFEDKDCAPPKQSNAESTSKRRHNSESANGINRYEKPYMNHNTNPIATLPRNPNATLQPQKLRDFKDVLVHKSDDRVSPNTHSVLELDIMPS